jgi:uncharacterized OB-fold protein
MVDMSTHPVLKPDHLSQPFWDAVKNEKLMVQYDTEVGKFQWWPRPVSIYTGKNNRLEWRQVSGKGKVASFSVINQALFYYKAIVPYMLGAIELDEGVRMYGRIVNIPHDKVKLDMRVRVAFETLPDGNKLYVFEPDV